MNKKKSYVWSNGYICMLDDFQILHNMYTIYAVHQTKWHIGNLLVKTSEQFWWYNWIWVRN